MTEQTYRFRGVTRNGGQQFGRFTSADLPAEVKRRFDAGWRSLHVYAGDGPLPPSPYEPNAVAAIGPHPQTGRRTWWAES